ncbi:hypothetical protein FRB99_001353 [Tulasnella sp. 403]|nr:hypothetical protein FRB99_001353 [Tulasnella sp. 403]
MPATKTQTRSSSSTSTTYSFYLPSRPDGYPFVSSDPQPAKPRARFVPTRSNSTDSSATDDQDYASLPANAFSVMHQWELESLEKWQRRLEHLRLNQKVIKGRIDSLRQNEEKMWTESVHPHSRSSSSSSSDADPRAFKTPKKPGVPVGEYGEWVNFLYAELASLQAELEQNKDAEVKAMKGIRKATTRLERLRALEERWRAPSPTPSPPMSRSTSPVPDHQHQRHHQARPTKPQPRKNSTSSTKSTPTADKPSTKSTRKAPSPPPASKPNVARSKPLQPSSQTASLDPWLSYEDRWHQIQTNSSGIVMKFSTIPWPMATQPSSPEKITTRDIKEFLLSPRAVRASAKVSERHKERNPTGADFKSRKAVLRDAILRWHPDKFLSKYLDWVVESDRAAVREGVGKVIRCLNEIMQVEAARERMV